MSRIASTPQLLKEVSPVRTLRPVVSVENESVDAERVDNERVDAEPEEEDARRIGARANDESLTAMPHTAAPSALSAKARTRWFNRPLVALTSAAAAIALIVGGVTVTNSVQSTNFSSAQAQALSSISSAADLQRVSAKVEHGGTATLVWSPSLGKSALIAKGLKSLPAGKTYELWYIDAKGATPAGTFSGGDDRKSWRVLDGKMGAGDTIGMTVEPAGGSKSPTTAPIVAITSTT